MAIAVRASGTSSFDVNTTSTTLTVPAGVVNGDLMVVAISWSFGASNTIGAPAAFTNLFNTVGSGSMRAGVWYRVASSEPASYTWTLSSANSYGASLQTFSGVDTGTPIDASGSSGTNTGVGTLSVPSVAVVTDQAWEVIGWGDWNAGVPSATGFTVVKNGATPNQLAAVLYNQTPKSVGSTGTVTVSDTGATGGQILSGMPFAIRPAAVASVPFIFQQNALWPHRAM